MKNPLPRTALLVFIALLIIGLVSTIAWLQGAAEGRPDRRLFSLSVFVVSAATILNLLLRWIRWHFLLRTFSIRMRARESFSLFLAMLPMTWTPWAIGEILLFPALRRYSSRPFSHAAILWFTSRAADAGALLLLGSIWLKWLALPAALLSAVALFSMDSLERRSHSLLRLARLVLFFMISILAWLLVATSFYAAVHIQGGDVSLPSGLQIFGTGTLGGSLLGIPGGVATAGGIMINRLLLAGVAENIAIWSVLATRSGTALLSLLIGLGAIFLYRRSLLHLFRTEGPGSQGHFEHLSEEYAHQIPTHIRDRLVQTKSSTLMRCMTQHSVPANGHGLDIGCGQAWYAAHFARNGYTMAGCDPAAGQIRMARTFLATESLSLDLQTSGAEQLPFPDNTFDFAYAINVFHHIVDPRTRQQAFSEAIRVLKPGAPFFLFEMNTLNPLFRLYMSYLFPLLRDIDDGTEIWLTPSRLPVVNGAHWSPEFEFITFAPDFLPKFLVKPASYIESKLEHSRLRKFSAHLLLTLIKTPPENFSSPIQHGN